MAMVIITVSVEESMDSLYLHDGFSLQLLELPCENHMTLLGSVSVILCIFMNMSGSTSYEDLPGGKQNGHHETVSEQEGMDPLYLYEGFRF